MDVWLLLTISLYLLFISIDIRGIRRALEEMNKECASEKEGNDDE